jgi:hypothetical protein
MATETAGADFGPTHAAVAGFVDRMRRLTDEQRIAAAEERKRVDEEYHEKALRAAAEALAGRGEAYARARRALAAAHVPEALRIEGDERDAEQVRRWTEISRLVQLAIDEMLVALIASDVLHPNHLRELSRPWASYAAESTASTSSP